MGRARYNHNSFSIGFLSRRIHGNTDFEGYNNALDECVNFVIQPTGGLFKRTGTYFVAEAHSDNPRLVLFSYSAEDQYILEFGAQYIRYFTKYGPLTHNDETIVETVTEFSATDVHSMTVQQDGNILILITNKGLYTLERTAVDEFLLQKEDYTSEPLTFTNNEKVALKPSATSGTITITVVDPSNDSNKPNARFAPFFKDSDVGHFIVLSYRLPDADNVVGIQNYYLKIATVTADTGGFNKVTATIDTERSYQQKNQLPSVTSVVRWQLGAFTEDRGTPKASAFYEGRLFLANNTTYPTGIWGSSKLYNDWSDFYTGTNDADAVMFKMTAQNADEILWLASQSKLFAGTRWGIYIAGSATYNDEAITPSNFRIRLFEASGASPLQPVLGMDSVFFVDVSGKKVHEIHLSAETGAYQADDISLLSDDLTQSGILAHTWQQNPIQTYWCAVEDGYLCSLTYLKSNGIMAWAKHEIMGNNVKIEQLCTMHGDKNDLVWMVVRRQIGNQFKRYIEYMHAPFDPLQQEEFKQFYVDSGATKELKSSVSNIDRGSNPQLKIKISDATAQMINEMIPVNSGMFEVTFDAGIVTLPSTANWYSVCYGNGKFVTVASDSDKAAYSVDGINWTAASLPSSANWKSVGCAEGNGTFVAVAPGSTAAAYSGDGITWTAATLPSSAYWINIAYGNGKFVVISTNFVQAASSAVAYSTNFGATWSGSTMPGGEWHAFTYGNDKFVAINYNSDLVAYSSDGTTWNTTTMPSSARWYSVCYGGGKFVAIATDGSTAAAYSEDGITWHPSNPLPSGSQWQSICYGNGRFVVIDRDKNVAYSGDGITWTAVTLPSSDNWLSVTYGGKFVAVAYSSDKAVYSEDGITWNNKKVNTPPWSSHKKFFMTNLSIIEESTTKYLVGTLFDYYETRTGKVAAKIKTADFDNPTEGASCWLNVSQIFGLNSDDEIKCDTRYLFNSEEVVLFDSDIPNYPTTGESYIIQDKAADSVRIKKEGVYLTPTKGNFFKKISDTITVLTSPADLSITLEDDIADDPARVYINKVSGMTQINQKSYKVASVSTNKRVITLYDEKMSEICGTDIPLDGSLFSPFDTVNPKGNVYVYFSEMGGLSHLEGQKVDVCADGNKRDPRVVTNGKITFDHPVMYCSAGLAVKGWMKTTPFSGGSVLGSSVGAVGGQKSMWLHLYYSLGGRYGSEKAKTYPIPYSNFISGFNKPKSLVTGLVKCPIANSKDIYDRSVYIEHSDPVAFNILSITQDIEVSDS